MCAWVYSIVIGRIVCACAVASYNDNSDNYQGLYISKGQKGITLCGDHFVVFLLMCNKFRGC